MASPAEQDFDRLLALLNRTASRAHVAPRTTYKYFRKLPVPAASAAKLEAFAESMNADERAELQAFCN